MVTRKLLQVVNEKIDEIYRFVISDDNTLMIASGPIDQYWTKERINNLKIFKESKFEI